MKTAAVPNDTMTTTLMKVTAELTLALEDYEQHLIHQTSARMGVVSTTIYDELIEHLGAIPEDKVKGIREIITRGVIGVASEINTCVLIHERALGMTNDQAPPEIAKKSIDVLQEHLIYWSDV